MIIGIKQEDGSYILANTELIEEDVIRHRIGIGDCDED